jgi:hypothetical protein
MCLHFVGICAVHYNQITCDWPITHPRETIKRQTLQLLRVPSATGGSRDSTCKGVRRLDGTRCLNLISGLMTDAVSSSETPVNFYDATRRCISHDDFLQFRCPAIKFCMHLYTRACYMHRSAQHLHTAITTGYQTRRCTYSTEIRGTAVRSPAPSSGRTAITRKPRLSWFCSVTITK